MTTEVLKAITHARRAAACRIEAERNTAAAGVWLAVALAESQRSRLALVGVVANCGAGASRIA